MGLAVASVIVLGLATNWVAAGLLALTIGFYVFVYTMWLKRRTPQNIVIGGAAGAGGLVVSLKSSRPAVLALPASVTVPAGASAASFTLSSTSVTRNRSVTVTATASGRSVVAVVTVVRR